MNYWLLKSEPDVFGIDDLERVGVEPWTGVRNYQARNMMRDQMKLGDRILFYHSNCEVPGIVGLMRVARESYPDPTSWDPQNKYFDPKSTPDDPRWFMVDVRFERKLCRTITLAELKRHPALAQMPLVRKGSRLSVMPVTEDEWNAILAME